MRMQRRLFCLLSAAGGLSACAVPRPPAAPAAQVGIAPAGSTRGAEECDAAMDSVVAHQLAVPPAKMRTILVPPRPPNGQTAIVTFHVDRQGAVIADSTEISGVTDPVYLVRLRAVAAQSTFWPTVVNGCAVPATAELRIGSAP